MRFHANLAVPVLLAASCAAAAGEDSTIAGLQRLAARGNAEALYHLGMAYQTGTGVVADPARALGYFRQAAERGDPLGAYKLGCVHAGQGGLLPVDTAQALRWKMVAAEAGYALAQGDVAFILAERGEHRASMAWFQRAAAQGTSSAMMNFASANDNAAFGRNPVNTAAYFALVLARDGGSADQQEWLSGYRSRMTAAQRQEADAIVAAYSPAPTPLTIKARSGVAAAQELVAAHPIP